MDAMDELYQKVAKGTYNEVELQARAGAMKKRIREARSGSSDDRRLALKVVSALDASDRSEMLGMYLSDELPEIRAHALNLAVELRGDGLRVLREACLVPHTDVALRALQLLTQGVDKTATRRVQGVLTSGNAQIRAAAIRFLSHAAGAGVIPRLTRMLADPDRRVAYAAEIGIERLKGERPKRQPMGFWEAPPLEDESPEDEVEAELTPADIDSMDLPPPPPPIDGLGDLGSLSALAPLATPNLPSPTSTPSPKPQRGPSEATTGPSTLPVEAYALVKLLGRVAADERPPILAKLASATDVRVAVDKLARSTEAKDRCSAAIAIGGLKITPRLAVLMRMFRDADANVRAVAATAIAPLAGASALAQISRLFSDANPDVRSAAAVSIARAAVRLDQGGFARNALRQLDADPDDRVAEAVQKARRLLGD